MEKFLDVLKDSALDSLKILPVIFLVYVLIEFLESRESEEKRLKKIFGNRFSPFFGAAIGIIPQCGFSVVATKLYQGGYILAGTLIAVYIATSDEALPIMFSRAVTESVVWGKLALIIAIKFVYACIAGFAINALIKKDVKEIKEDEDDVKEDEDGDGCCHHKITGKREALKTLLFHPLIHSLKIIAYVFVVSFAFGLIVELLVGEERLSAFLSSSLWLQPLLSGVVGLIPNCASSVLITELFCDGYLSLGGALAGLAANSGIGLAVLFKNGENVKKSLLIALTTFALALILGYGVTAITALI
ncbi:MAG TPA: hypothetical protein DDY77_02015 [Clostridiales bacterium]|nr:hypothetical protein [Clostridiales bacterium]